MYANQAPTVKDMCYLRLTKMIENGDITFDEKIGNQNYVRQDLKHACSVENEFLEECSVVRFKELPNGGRKLLSKKEMNAKLGKDRSMDLLDPCAMRMCPCANIPYGEELEQGFKDVEEEEADNGGEFATADSMNVYDDTNWY